MADRLKFALLSLLVALVTFVAAPIAKGMHGTRKLL